MVQADADIDIDGKVVSGGADHLVKDQFRFLAKIGTLFLDDVHEIGLECEAVVFELVLRKRRIEPGSYRQLQFFKFNDSPVLNVPFDADAGRNVG